MRRPRSLASRLVITAVALVAVTSVLIGTVTTVAMHRYLFDRLDQQVHQSMDGLVPPRRVDDDDGPIAGPGPNFAGLRTVNAAFPDGADAQGFVIAQSEERGGYRKPLSSKALDELGGVPSDGEVHDLQADCPRQLPGHRPGRDGRQRRHRPSHRRGERRSGEPHLV